MGAASRHTACVEPKLTARHGPPKRRSYIPETWGDRRIYRQNRGCQCLGGEGHGHGDSGPTGMRLSPGRWKQLGINRGNGCTRNPRRQGCSAARWTVGVIACQLCLEQTREQNVNSGGTPSLPLSSKRGVHTGLTGLPFSGCVAECSVWRCLEFHRCSADTLELSQGHPAGVTETLYAHGHGSNCRVECHSWALTGGICGKAHVDPLTWSS